MSNDHQDDKAIRTEYDLLRSLMACFTTACGVERPVEITGFLSESATFKLSITGPFGEEELQLIISSLQLYKDLMKGRTFGVPSTRAVEALEAIQAEINKERSAESPKLPYPAEMRHE